MYDVFFLFSFVLVSISISSLMILVLLLACLNGMIGAVFLVSGLIPRHSVCLSVCYLFSLCCFFNIVLLLLLVVLIA